MDKMDSSKQQLVEKLKSANNVLVTVRANPSVDQLAACIGLTLILNKMDKHATAVFSGEIPPAIEFLEPEKTIEKNTDSLRDFIIALDKSKADKLRYKVEDKVVKIFITPYRTSIGQDDLEFSQGDFNVDVVVALGVQEQQDLDQAITSHGRILHDATVVSVNTSAEGGLGSINWHEPAASSLSELVAEVSDSLGKNLLDTQNATALLTGIVAETNRFSNDKTSSKTMTISAELMAAGANQQLVASKLEEAPGAEQPSSDSGADSQSANSGDEQPPKPDDGSLEIKHDSDEQPPKPDENPPEKASGNTAKPASALDSPTAPPSATQLRPQPYMQEPPSSISNEELPITPASESIGTLFDPLSLPPIDDSPKPPPVAPLESADTAPPEIKEEPLAPQPSATEGPTPQSPPPQVKESQPPKKEFEETKPAPSLDNPKADKLPSEPEASNESSSSHPSAAPDQIHIDEQGILHNGAPGVAEKLPDIPPSPPQPPPSNGDHSSHDRTLTEIEEDVHSPHVGFVAGSQAPPPSTPGFPDEDTARDEVNAALNSAPPDISNKRKQNLNSEPLGPPLHTGAGDSQPSASAPPVGAVMNEPAPNADSPADAPLDMPLPPGAANGTSPMLSPLSMPPETGAKDPSPPPPVPPPMMPPSFMNSNESNQR